MPKNKKPAGGRPSRNFDPHYADKKKATRPGSRSEGHRGYRPADDESAPKKRRWTSDERAARGVSASRPRGAQHDERGAHSADRRDDGRRTYGDDRRTFGGGERRTYGGDERRSYRDRDERAPRGAQRDGYRSDRSTERYGNPGQNDRGARDERRDGYRGRDDRYERNDNGGAQNDTRGRDDRRHGDERRRDERPRFENRDRYQDRSRRDERPRHDGERRDDRFGDRPRNRYEADRPRRSFDEDRPRRSYDADRPRRAYDNDRPRRDVDEERPRRSYDADRPRRSFEGERPRRSFDGDRPRRGYDNDRPSFDEDRPRRRFDDRDSAPRERRDSSFYPQRDRAVAAESVDDVVLERLEAQAIEASEVEGVTFGDLGLGNNIVRALADLGAATPFPIQAATIPEVLAGRDVLGRGRTGSGKTIAFGAPLVERLMQLWTADNGANSKRALGRAPRALIMAPTRELALQIDRTVQPIARSVGLFTTQIYGGVPQARQVGALRRGIDIVIGTPGRIEDLIEQGHLDLSEVVVTVLDEADHMCDLGFLEPVQRILRRTSGGGQKLLFSATLDSGVAKLVEEFLTEPAVHEVAGEDQASGTIDHRVFVIEHREKRAIVEQLADRDGKTLIFARTRAFAEELADMLDDAGVPAVSLHGDLNQSRRQRNLDKLTSGRVSVLVATDVAARGIHVDDIDLVIQADAPDEYKTYLHRSGRTGRAGKPGTVVTIISRNRQRRMASLLGRAEIDVEFEDIYPGDDVLSDLNLRAPAARMGRPERAHAPRGERVADVVAPTEEAFGASIPEVDSADGVDAVDAVETLEVIEIVEAVE
jgi:superfamily II DNA/RNA helicase